MSLAFASEARSVFFEGVDTDFDFASALKDHFSETRDSVDVGSQVFEGALLFYLDGLVIFFRNPMGRILLCICIDVVSCFALMYSCSLD